MDVSKGSKEGDGDEHQRLLTDSSSLQGFAFLRTLAYFAIWTSKVVGCTDAVQFLNKSPIEKTPNVLCCIGRGRGEKSVAGQ